jgi:hypothetical protein
MYGLQDFERVTHPEQRDEGGLKQRTLPKPTVFNVSASWLFEARGIYAFVCSFGKRKIVGGSGARAKKAARASYLLVYAASGDRIRVESTLVRSTLFGTRSNVLGQFSE